MEFSTVYHRPDSEMAYVNEARQVELRIRVKNEDVKQVRLVYADPFLLMEGQAWLEAEMDKIATTDLHEYYQASVHVATNRLAYYFEIMDKTGSVYHYGELGIMPLDKEKKSDSNVALNNVFKMPYVHDVDAFHSPDWVKETVWYQIFPERFHNGNSDLSPQIVQEWDSERSPHYQDFYGGDIPGIIQKLDYLQNLGINGIYLCPIFHAHTNHKYDTIDYFSIDPHFGTLADFKQLVKEAHQRGIRIMLDAVFNHMGTHSPQWQDVIEKGQRSKYKDWFHIHDFPVNQLRRLADGTYNYETFAFADQMPKLNTSNPEVQSYLLSIASYWIEECDIDGWRLDVANEIDHQFWKKFHQTVTAIKPDFFILGEVWHNAQSWLNGDEFHSVMNYPLTYAIKDYFINQSMDERSFVHLLDYLRMTYRDSTNQVLFNMMDSHDTERLLYSANQDKEFVKLALTFMFLQMGTPCIYYGTEVGLNGGADPDCRRVMPWEGSQQDLEMYQFIQKLIQVRKAFASVIECPKYRHLIIEQAGVLKIQVSDGQKTLVAIFNRSDKIYSFEESGHIQLANLLEDGQVLPKGCVIYLKEEV